LLLDVETFAGCCVVGYLKTTVALTTPSCDERELLAKSFLEAGARKGEVTSYLAVDPGDAESPAQEFQSNFYLFICNPRVRS